MMEQNKGQKALEIKDLTIGCLGCLMGNTQWGTPLLQQLGLRARDELANLARRITFKYLISASADRLLGRVHVCLCREGRVILYVVNYA